MGTFIYLGLIDITVSDELIQY